MKVLILESPTDLQMELSGKCEIEPTESGAAGLRFCKAPEFFEAAAARAFEREVFKNSPHWNWFIRPCSRSELRPGAYDTLREHWGEVYMLVHRIRAKGGVVRFVFTSLDGIVDGLPSFPIVGWASLFTFEPEPDSNPKLTSNRNARK